MTNFTLVLLFSLCAHVFCINIITRTEWGARIARSITELKTPRYVIVHHTATPKCLTQRTCKRRVQNIQGFHLDTKRWADIGFNFLIGGDGNVYEGTGWEFQGTHTKGYNNKSLGIALIGNFMNERPSNEQVNILKNLIDLGVEQDDIDPQYRVMGHGQVTPNQCPGDYLQYEIETWDNFYDLNND